MTKLNKIFTLLVLLLTAASGNAVNSLYINKENLEPGQPATLTLSLDNDETFYGFSAEVTLPAGVEWIRESSGKLDFTLSDRCAGGDYQVVTNLNNINNRRVIIGTFSTTNPQVGISGTSGVLATIPVNVSPNYSGGEATVTKIHLVAANDRDVPVNNSSTALGVLPVSIQLNEHQLTMNRGDEKTLVGTIIPDYSSDKSITWVSSDSSVASVSSEGVVAALKSGKTTITSYTVNGKTDSCEVEVFVYAEGITLDKSEMTIVRGESESLTAIPNPIDTTDEITWASSNEDIAIYEDGKVVAKEKGEVEITATCGGYSAVCKVTVIVLASEIIVEPNPLRLMPGQTYKLEATVLPEETNDKTVTWSSSNPEIATVDDQGNVEAIALGQTIVTVRCGDVMAECQVDVVPRVASEIILDPDKATLKVGETLSIGWEVLPEDTTDKTVYWSSNSPAIATVDTNGNVLALALGEAEIIARCDNVIATCMITVVPTPVESFTVNEHSIEIKIGDTFLLETQILPEDATDKTVVFITDNETIANVDAVGNITGVSVGETVITASCGDLTDTCRVKVLPIEAEKIILDPEEAEVKIGESIIITATVEPENTTNKTVTWTSENEEIATVDASGKVTGVNPGETTITATCGSVSATCRIKVPAIDVIGLALSSNSLLMKVGNVSDLDVIYDPANATDKSVKWEILDEAIATVDEEGNVTAKAVGTTTVVVTSLSNPSAQATCTVTVEADIILATNISINREKLEMIEGDTFKLEAIVTPEDVTDPTVTWESSDATHATVAADGLVTAVTPGQAIIYASTSNGLTVKCDVTVLPRKIEPSGITLNKTTLLMREGYTAELIPFVSPENADDKSVTWTTDAPGIATVDQNGIVTAILQGEATITATTVNGLTATCRVTVIPDVVPVTGLELNEHTKVVTVGDGFELIATLTPENATDKSITWESSDPTKATVTQEGKVSTVGVGEVLIFATSSNGITDRCFVTINPKVVLPSGISLSKQTMTMRQGHTTDLLAFVEPVEADDKSVTWRSSDPTIVSVDENGVVTSINLGVATVTATTVNGLTAECEVTVIPDIIQVSKLEVNPDQKIVTVGDVFTLVAVITPEDATDKTVTWRSSDPAKASVSETGEVTTKAVGEVTIYASSANGMTGTCLVTIQPGEIEPTGITLSATSMTLHVGESGDLLALVQPDDATDKSVTWSSDNSGHVTVDASGKVTGLSQGEAVVTATTSNGLSATCTVTVLPNEIPVTGLKLSDKEKTVTVGDAPFTLIATVEPENATDKTVTWRSSDPSKATVTQTGEVTPLAVGQVTIYASTSNGLTETCLVTILPGTVEPTGITLSATSMTLHVGESGDLLALVQPDDATDKSVTWSSNNSGYVTVDASGKVTGLSQGEAIVTATTVNGLSATCTVTVLPNEIPATGLKLSDREKTVTVGDAPFTLIATVEPENATDKTVTWRSSDPSKATVTQTGEVTPLAVGQVTIFASTSNGLTETCLVTILPGYIPVESITLSNSELLMEIGETASLTAMVNPAEASNKDVTWSTASDAIATVDDNGVVTAICDGVTEITVTSVADPTISAICKVTVKKGIVPVTGISLNEHSKELEEGDNFTLIATITPEDATDKTVTWTTSNPAVATVADNGVVTAVTAGTATILATASNGAFDQCEITVVRGDVDVERISLSNTELTLTEGEETDLLAIVLPADATDKHVRWSLHDDSIINLDPVTEEDADGNVITNKALIKALKAGETNIIVTSVSNPKATAMCKVTVKAVYIPVTTVTLDPTEKTIEEGESFTITPTVEPENATEPALTWSSSAEAIATVSENGEVTGVTPGSAIIYATASNGVYGQCVVTVVRGDVDVERISLSNTELTLTEGEETDLLAIVLPADATDKHVTWSVPDETVINLTPATEEDADGNVITNRSLIKALTAGETIITVTSVSNPKATAVCKVTVKSAYIPVTKVTLDPSEKTIEEGETFIITPSVEPENATEPSLTWSSSAEAVATVSDNGEVTGITPGTATIYATASNGSYGQCVVTVVRGEVDVERISLSNTELYLTEGEETDIFAIVLPTDATDKRVTWSLADDDIISLAEPLEDEIESAAPSKCYIKALKAGETTITVTSVSNPEVTAECKVTVSPLFIAVEGITLNEHYKEVLEGTIFTLVATVTPENATNKEVTWSTSAESIAVVSDSGEVTALSTGTATIYATTSNGLYDSCEVTVVKGEVPVIGLALTSYELFLTEGEVTDLDAFIRPSDATDQRVTWSIDQSSVASVVDASYVNENGSRVNTSIVTAGVAGEAIITVTSVANPEVYAECKVTVTPAFKAVEGIELNRTSLVMTEGETFDLIAIITPENATDSSVAWVSSNVDVATVSDTGVVTASKAGNSVIHATASNGLFATCDVTVLPRTIEVESIYVEPSELIIWQGEEAVLKAIVLPEDATDKTITWTSNAPDIVSVEDGVVLGLQEGIATVMAKSVNGKTAFCAVKVKGRPLTPKQLLRKGDGTTSTFVIMMPISDAELAENGYNFVTGYTDKEGVSSIIADTPLRYSHTTPEIYNNPEYDFWAFAYVRSESGEVINSNLRHLDGREEVCVDASVYGFNTKGGSVKGAEDWITVMPKKVRIEASSNNEMEISIFTLTGLQVYGRSFTGNNRVVEEIELSQFVAGPYVVTVKCDGEEKSKKIVVR